MNTGKRKKFSNMQNPKKHSSYAFLKFLSEKKFKMSDNNEFMNEKVMYKI